MTEILHPPDAVEPDGPKKKKSKSHRVQVAGIHAHFNIFRDQQDTQTGDVTVEEQIKALDRFVRWHVRQVEIGRTLLAQLQAKAEGRPND